MSKPKIAVVGGSIAGLALSTILKRLGYDITVFERSKAKFTDRGAGIMLPKTLLQRLLDQNLLPQDFSSITIRERIINTYDKANDTEKFLITHPFHSQATLWTLLHHGLVKQAPKDLVKYGATVSQVADDDAGVTLTVDGNQHHFDHVFFADGYNSIGRKHYFSDLKPTFADYIAWRGTLSARDQEDYDRLYNKAVFYVYKKGHMLIYPLPNKSSQSNKDKFILNWVLYETVDKQHPVYQAAHDKENYNVAKGKLSEQCKTYLHQLVDDYFPPYPREMIKQTNDPFIQAISDMMIPQLSIKHSSFVGDSSVLLRPHAGAGSTKALEDVLALEEVLKKQPDFSTAIDQWSKSQLQAAKNYFKISEVIGKLFVTEVPEWEKLSESEMDDLWQNAVSELNWYLVKKD